MKPKQQSAIKLIETTDGKLVCGFVATGDTF